LRWARASSCGRRRATHVPHRATFFRRVAPCRLVPERVGSFADVLAHDLATTRRARDTRQVVFVESSGVMRHTGRSRTVMARALGAGR
jgi:hypothetical protein